MIRAGNLFGQFASFEHLWAAFRRARRGARLNRRNAPVIFSAENEVLQLREELLNGTYHPRPYRYFQIYEPKKRIISVADFRDRVVHHALVGVLEPVFERQFDYDSYATRKNKGAHAAIRRAQRCLQQNEWFLKADIDSYFAAIRHDTLLDILRRKIKDERLLEVAARIIRAGGPEGCGLPIGNLTSQFLANVYLDPYDRFVRQNLGARAYIRYMDDFVLFHPDKSVLKFWQKQSARFLTDRLGLRLKPSATFINSRQNGLTFLGRRVFPATVRIAAPNLRRALAKLHVREADYLAGRDSEECYLQSLNSLFANLASADTLGLRRRLFR